MRYIVPNGDGTNDACNKYMRCPTWDDLRADNIQLKEKIAQYEMFFSQFKKFLS